MEILQIKNRKTKRSVRRGSRQGIRLLICIFIFVFLSGTAFALSPGSLDIVSILYFQLPDYEFPIFAPPTVTSPATSSVTLIGF